MFRILLILHFFLFIFIINKEWKKFSNFKFINLLLGIWILGNFLSLFWAIVPGESLRYIYYSFEASYLIWLIMYYINDRKSYRLLVNVIICFYFIALIIGCIEVITGWHLPLSGSNFYNTSTSKFQPTAFLFNTNDYAMFLCIFFPLVFYSLWKSNRMFINVFLAMMVLIISFYLVVMTYSRLGIISMILESILVFWIYMRRSIVFILFFTSVYLFISAFGDKSYFFKIINIIQEAFTKKGASTNERMEIYSTSWDIVRDSHFLGVGAGNVPIQIKNYWLGHHSVGHVYKSAHNFWLESMGGIGVFSLSVICLFILIVSITIRYWWKNKNHINNIKYFLPILIVIVFYFSSIGLSTIIEKRFLWLALGIAIKLSSNNSIKLGGD
ncbi:O-antigen ligase family protein [Bacillus thuringiensis]|nr:O-antigen ligase family protein [Bacillus thuringiensis]